MGTEDDAVAVARARAWLASGRARAIREKSGLSQAETGRAVGTNGPQVCRWESGHAVPRWDHALRLARLLSGLEEISREETGAGP